MAAHDVRMMPSEESAKYVSVVSTLRKRFQSLDIEELKRLEFHQLMQGMQSVEELGVVLQKLARKAFPDSGAKEFDRMLKGCYYQALLPKWQRKLGAPKTGETFEDLYARTRAMERHDQQIGRQDDSSYRKPSMPDEPPRRRTQPVSQGRATLGTVVPVKMRGVGVEVVSTVEKWDISSEIVRSYHRRHLGDPVARCRHW